MSTDRDVTRTVRSWMDEGVTQLPDRVLDAVLDQIPAIPQRRASWLARRFPVMNSNTVRFGLVAAAVVVIALLGARLLPESNFGGPPAPTPTVEPTPTPSPVPTSTPAVAPFGSLTPGQYALSGGPGDPPRFVLTVPGGWQGNGWVISKYAGDPPEGMAIAAWLVGNVYTDGCHWSGTLLNPPVGPTVGDLATALAGLEGRDATTPSDITVDGYAGKQLDLTVPADILFADCDEGQFRTWVDPNGEARFHQGPGEHSRIWILDVDGVRVLIFGRDFPDTSAQDRAELEQIMNSIRFEP